MSERMKFEIVAVLARIATFATPFIMAAMIWLHAEIRALAENQRDLLQWKEVAPATAELHHNQVKMEVMMLVSSQLLDIQKNIVEMRTIMAGLVKQQEQRDERRNQAGE